MGNNPKRLEPSSTPGKITVRFAGPHIHEGKPFEAGDEIEVDAHWAGVLRDQGHTVSPKE